MEVEALKCRENFCFGLSPEKIDVADWMPHARLASVEVTRLIDFIRLPNSLFIINSVNHNMVEAEGWTDVAPWCLTQ